MQRKPEKTREEWLASRGNVKKPSAAVSTPIATPTAEAATGAVQFAVPQDVFTAFQIIQKLGPEEAERILSGKKESIQKVEEAADWQDSFKSKNQLEEGDVRMLIKDFLPEGITFIGALPSHGKTFFALSIVKSLTTGCRFLGKYEPEGIIPVLYLVPESSGRAFRMRLNAFGIPDDRARFLCRTISEGAVLKLDHPAVLEAVKELHPVVFLDTMIRFNDSSDENSATENKAVADNIFELRAAGAPAVIALHHSPKNFAEGEITLENCLRGTGDIAALCDSVYALRRDRMTYDNGNGSEELEVHCVKPRDIKNPPKPFRVALKYKKEDGALASVIDETGDVQIVDSSVVQMDRERKFVKAVTDDPSISRDNLSEELGITIYALYKLAKKLGWNRSTGRYGAWSIALGATTNLSPAATAKKQKQEANKEAEKENEAPLFKDQSCQAE